VRASARTLQPWSQFAVESVAVEIVCADGLATVGAGTACSLLDVPVDDFVETVKGVTTHVDPVTLEGSLGLAADQEHLLRLSVHKDRILPKIDSRTQLESGGAPRSPPVLRTSRLPGMVPRYLGPLRVRARKRSRRPLGLMTRPIVTVLPPRERSFLPQNAHRSPSEVKPYSVGEASGSVSSSQECLLY